MIMGKYMILYRDDRTFLLQQGETYTVYDAGTGEPGAVFMLDSPPRDIIDSDGNLAIKADYEILYVDNIPTGSCFYWICGFWSRRS